MQINPQTTIPSDEECYQFLKTIIDEIYDTPKYISPEDHFHGENIQPPEKIQ